jgi:hypothetical protein
MAFVTLTFLAISLIYGPSISIKVFADYKSPLGYSCKDVPTTTKTICCQKIGKDGWCTECDNTSPPSNCTDRCNEKDLPMCFPENKRPQLGNANVPPTGGAIVEPGPKAPKNPDANVPPSGGEALNPVNITQGHDSPIPKSSAHNDGGSSVVGNGNSSVINSPKSSDNNNNVNSINNNKNNNNNDKSPTTNKDNNQQHEKINKDSNTSSRSDWNANTFVVIE